MVKKVIVKKNVPIPVTSEPRANVPSVPVAPRPPSGTYTWAAKPGYELGNHEKYADEYTTTSEKLYAPKAPKGLVMFQNDIDINKQPTVLNMKIFENGGNININEMLGNSSIKTKKIRDLIGLRR